MVVNIDMSPDKDTVWTSIKHKARHDLAAQTGCSFDGSVKDFSTFLQRIDEALENFDSGIHWDYDLSKMECYALYRGVRMQNAPVPSMARAISMYWIRCHSVKLVQLPLRLDYMDEFQAKLIAATKVLVPIPGGSLQGTDACVSLWTQDLAPINQLYGLTMHPDVSVLRVHILSDRNSHSGMVVYIPTKDRFLLLPTLEPPTKTVERMFYKQGCGFDYKQNTAAIAKNMDAWGGFCSVEEYRQFAVQVVYFLRWIYFGKPMPPV